MRPENFPIWAKVLLGIPALTALIVMVRFLPQTWKGWVLVGGMLLNAYLYYHFFLAHA